MGALVPCRNTALTILQFPPLFAERADDQLIFPSIGVAPFPEFTPQFNQSALQESSISTQTEGQPSELVHKRMHFQEFDDPVPVDFHISERISVEAEISLTCVPTAWPRSVRRVCQQLVGHCVVLGTSEFRAVLNFCLHASFNSDRVHGSRTCRDSSDQGRHYRGDNVGPDRRTNY